MKRRTIGLELEIARVRAGKTLEQVATELGVNQGIISFVENERREYPPEFIERIKAVVGWTPSISLIVDEAEAICERN